MMRDTLLTAESSMQRLTRAEGMVSILMPSHNLQDVIAGNIRRVYDVFKDKVPFEILPIDDGSTDKTADRMREAAASLPEVKPVILARNLGKGGALRAGFEQSKGAFIVFLDADLDLPPDQIPSFFDRMEATKADIVIGSKQHPSSSLDYPALRRFISFCYYLFIKIAFNLPVHDTQTGLKLFRRQPLEWAFPRMLVKAFAFDLEVLAIAVSRHFKITEAPVRVEFHGSWTVIPVKAIRSVLNDTLAVFYRLHILKYYRSIPDVRIPDPPPLASIVIAYPSETHYLKQALAGIAAQTYPHYEVILLPDDAAGHPWPGKLREIPTGRVRPAEKRNIGIREARGSVVVFLDDDAYPAPDWLERALAYFTIPGVVGVGGPGVTPPDDPLMAQMSGNVYACPLVSGSARHRYLAERVREVDDFPSCNLFVTTEALRQAGGFRVDYWPGEDTLLCLDLTHTYGGRLLYEPRALVYHHRRQLFLPHLRQVGRYALHRGLFAKRFPQNSHRIAYWVPSLFVLGLAFGAVAAPFHPWIRMAYFGTILLYLLITFLFAFDRRVTCWILVWLGIISTHLVYGVRFLQGYLFGSAPRDVRRFDHPSEPVRPGVPHS
jgi:glycosyltransferase involved in cell wall biosynthesis